MQGNVKRGKANIRKQEKIYMAYIKREKEDIKNK